MIIPLKDFKGIMPRYLPEALPDNAAQVATDVDFTAGDLRGLPLDGVNATAGVTSPKYGFTDGTYTALFAVKDTSMVKMPALNDSHKRYYYTKDLGAMQVTTGPNMPGNAEPTTSWNVGVPKPTKALVGTTVNSFTRDTTKNVEWTFQLVYEKADGSVVKSMDAVAVPAAGSFSLSASQPSNRLSFRFDVPLYLSAGSPPAGGTFSVSNLKKAKWGGVLYEFNGTANCTVKVFGVGRIEVSTTGVGAAPNDIKVTQADGTVGSSTSNIATTTLDPATDTLATMTLSDSNTYVLADYIRSRMDQLGYGVDAPKPVLLTIGKDKTTGSEVFRMYSSNSSQTVNNATTLIPGGVSVDWVVYNSNSATNMSQWEVTYRLGTMERRNYVYTFVNEYGEESAPSPTMALPVDVDFFEDVRLTLDFTSAQKTAITPPACVPIKNIRVYRTATGTDYETDFQLVLSTEYKNYDVEAADLDNATWTAFVGAGLHTKSTGNIAWPGMAGSYLVDSKLADSDGKLYNRKIFTSYALQPRASWTPPEVDLQHLTAGAGGVLAAFKGNRVLFCEPYYPWVWPPEYEVAVEYPVMGIAPLGNGFLILTRANPYYVAGPHPSEYAVNKIPSVQGAVSRHAVAVIENAVAYACSDGIAVCDGASVTVKPMQMFIGRDSTDTWLTLVNDAPNMQFCYFDGWLFIIRRGTTNNYLIKLDDQETPTMTSYSRNLNFIGVADALPAWSVDYGNTVWGFSGNNYTQMFYYPAGRGAWTWRSKEFLLPKPVNFGAIQLFGTGTVTVTVYCDGVQRFTASAQLPDVYGKKILRLPSGFHAARWSVKLEGATRSGGVDTRIQAVYLANTVMELQGV